MRAEKSGYRTGSLVEISEGPTLCGIQLSCPLKQRYATGNEPRHAFDWQAHWGELRRYTLGQNRCRMQGAVVVGVAMTQE